MTSVRFTGGPLDGHTNNTEAPADEYRVVGGVYHRVRTHRRSSSPDALVTYRWLADDAEHRPTPVELVSMW